MGGAPAARQTLAESYPKMCAMMPTPATRRDELDGDDCARRPRGGDGDAGDSRFHLIPTQWTRRSGAPQTESRIDRDRGADTKQSDAISAYLWSQLSKAEEQATLKSYQPSGANANEAKEVVLGVFNKIKARTEHYAAASSRGGVVDRRNVVPAASSPPERGVEPHQPAAVAGDATQRKRRGGTWKG